MKTSIAILLGLLCLCFTSRAETFIYKHKFTVSVTGDGRSDKLAVSGWTIFDDSGYVVQIQSYPKAKAFRYWYPEGVEFDVVTGSLGREYTIVVQAHSFLYNGYDALDIGGAKGLNVNVSIAGSLWSIPKSFKWTGNSSFYMSNGQRKFEEATGTLTFDAKATNLSNLLGDDPDDAADRLAVTLLAQGYTEE